MTRTDFTPQKTPLNLDKRQPLPHFPDHPRFGPPSAHTHSRARCSSRAEAASSQHQLPVAPSPRHLTAGHAPPSVLRPERRHLGACGSLTLIGIVRCSVFSLLAIFSRTSSYMLFCVLPRRKSQTSSNYCRHEPRCLASGRSPQQTIQQRLEGAACRVMNSVQLHQATGHGLPQPLA